MIIKVPVYFETDLEGNSDEVQEAIELLQTTFTKFLREQHALDRFKGKLPSEKEIHLKLITRATVLKRTLQGGKKV